MALQVQEAVEVLAAVEEVEEVEGLQAAEEVEEEWQEAVHLQVEGEWAAQMVPPVAVHVVQLWPQWASPLAS